jgi:hypothetical protein
VVCVDQKRCAITSQNALLRSMSIPLAQLPGHDERRSAPLNGSSTTRAMIDLSAHGNGPKSSSSAETKYKPRTDPHRRTTHACLREEPYPFVMRAYGIATHRSVTPEAAGSSPVAPVPRFWLCRAEFPHAWFGGGGMPVPS